MKPRLSVIICVFDMPREAPRTIYSAWPPYQGGINEREVEVIIVDNGSSRPIPTSVVETLPPGIRVLSMPSPRPSPVFALNWAAANHARGDLLLFAIDGARIFSQGLYAQVLKAHELIKDAFVFTLGWHLGPKTQMLSSQEGYDQKVEDELIAQANWPQAPDALFEFSVFAGSSAKGFFAPISESNAFSMTRDLFERIGGYDERFLTPGGGLANLEIFQRYVMRPDARNVCLLGEGTFHQIHGGIATSNRLSKELFYEEYRAIFGRPYSKPLYQPMYLGPIRRPVLKFLCQSAEMATKGAE